MTAAMATLQIVVGITVLSVLFIARRNRNRRGVRRSSGDTWQGDASYSIADDGQHHGASGHHSGSDISCASGDSAGASDGGGSDGGGGDGGGGDGGGGGSSD
jgi:hypothetical protein